MHTFTPIGRLGLWFAMLLCVSITGMQAVRADVVPADDGTGTRVRREGNQTDIEGGSRSPDGENLFHSFEEFGLSADEIANFLSNPDIRNILGRVVGGDASVIDGLIRVSGGNSNLYLMNPAGVIFGVNARLDVPGSFTVTTADRIGFGEGWFTGVGPNDYSALVGNPNAFVFSLSQPGAIVNLGELSVAEGQDLNLFGGTVVNLGRLSAPGGTITIAAIPGENMIRLSQDGMILQLEIPATTDGNDNILTNALPFDPLSLPELLTVGASPDAGLTVATDGSVRLTNAGIVIPTESGTAIVSGTVDTSLLSASPLLTPEITVVGDRIGIISATIEASGIDGGGIVRIGGDYQGQGVLPNADRTFVSADSIINANALESGNGGTVIVWADGATVFYGSANVRGGNLSGDGGLIEISGAENLAFSGTADASAPVGTPGIVLFDPLTINIVEFNDEFNDNAELDDGQILFADGGADAVFEISDDAIEFIEGDVILQATGDINLTTSLEFLVTPETSGTTITFSAGGNFNGTDQDIIASGRNITISGLSVIVGDLDTSVEPGGEGPGGGINGGIITLTATNGDIIAGSIVTDSTFDVGNSGSGGTITLTTTNGNITTGSLITLSRTTADTGVAGNGGTITISSTGAINITTTDDFDAAISSISAANGVDGISSTPGAVNLSAANGITITGNIFADSFATTATNAGSGNGVELFTSGGNIAVTGNIFVGTTSLNNTGLLRINTPGVISLSGTQLSIQSADFTIGDQIAPNAALFPDFNTQGGDVNLAINGNFDFSNVVSTDGGNFTLSSTAALTVSEDVTTLGGNITLNGATVDVDSGLDSSNFSSTDTTVSGGDISITSTVGAIDTTAGELVTGGESESDDSVSRSGDVRILAQGDLRTGLISTYSAGSGDGGDVNLTSVTGLFANDDGIDSGSSNGNGGAITIVASSNITIDDSVYSGSGSLADSDPNLGNGTGGRISFESTSGAIVLRDEVRSTSFNSTGGAIVFSALQDITTDGLFSNSLTGTGGNINLTSTQGNINTIAGLVNANGANGGGIISFSADDNITLGNITLGSLLGTGGLRIDTDGIVDLQNSIITPNGARIDIGNTVAPDNIFFPSGTFITNGGNITIDNSSTLNISTPIVTNGGNIDFTSTGVINFLSSVQTAGGTIELQGSSLNTARLDSSLLNGQGGTITLNATSGTISTGILNSSGTNGGAIVLSAPGNITVDDITFGSTSGLSSGGLRLNSSGIVNLSSATFTSNGARIDIGNTIAPENILFSSGTFDTNGGNITVDNNSTLTFGNRATPIVTDGGNLRLTSDGALILSSPVTTDGGTVRLTSDGRLRVFEDIITNGGDIILDGQRIDTRNATLNSSDDDRGGAIRLNADGNITSGELIFGSTTNQPSDPLVVSTSRILSIDGLNANGTRINLSSDTNRPQRIILSGTIDTGGANLRLSTDRNFTLSRSSLLRTDGGDFVVDSNGTIDLFSLVRTTGGAIDLQGTRLELADLNTSNQDDLGGAITLEATDSTITTGNLNSSGNNGGTIFLDAETAITTGQINSSGNPGDGGDVTLDPSGDIQVSFIDARGSRNGGDILIETDRFFRATGRFSFGERSVSLLSFGEEDNGNITIRHGGNGLIPFEIGNAELNGTIAAITTGDDTLAPERSIRFSLTEGDIQIITGGTDTSGTSGRDLDQLPDPPPLPTDESINDDLSSPTPTIGLTTTIEIADLPAIEARTSSDYQRYLGLSDEEVRIKTLSQAHRELRQVEAETGGVIKPALIYVLFTPPEGTSGEATIMSLDQMQLDDQPERANDQVELVLVTARGEPIRQVLPVTRSEVTQVARNFRDFVTQAGLPESFYLPLAQRLYDWMIAPLESELETQQINTIAFILDAGLRATPLAALSDRNLPDTPEDDQFLIEKYNIGLMPSLSLTETEYRGVEEARVLAMGTSEFEQVESELVDLPFVRLEVMEIGGTLWQGTALLDEDFTANRLRSERQETPYGIVHLATHVIVEGSLEDSFIQFWDNSLTFDQVRSLNLNDVELLVLSACNTAVDNLGAELGFAGLAVQSGVKSALASLWQVSDEGTFALMIEFYRQLDQAPIKSSALRQAQLTLLNAPVQVERADSPGTIESVDFSHPYYWAAFTMVGSPW
ncbi:MAG: CHAT domain-containing protein [Cyanobacteria bacterium CRU_2_1]|nr:CHAT domain-containing protein [Cyanobacteria bacterium CRU_2_1]